MAPAPGPGPDPGARWHGRAAHRGGADGGGEVQGERPVLREAGGDGAAERPAGRGAAAGGALTDSRHGKQPGSERGRG